MTHTPETDAIDGLCFLAPVFLCLERKFLVPKINVAESDVDNKFNNYNKTAYNI